MTTLRWATEDGGVRFQVQDGSDAVPVQRWALATDLKTENATRAHVGPLLQWLADERAWQMDSDVIVPGAVIADASPLTLQALGLPPQAPYTIELTKEGLWTDRTFNVRWRLLASGGRPVLGMSRQGVIITVGSRRYTLLNPLFRVVEAVEEVNAAQDRESRLAGLSQLQDCLPPDAAVDSHLKETRVARADALTLNVRKDERGEVQIDPIPVRRVGRQVEDLSDGEDEPREVLPPARQDEWARHFRRLGSRAILTAGEGWFLTVSPNLQRALDVVREVQQAPAAERLAFARNPRPRLQAALAAELSEEELEQLFAETASYGERVRDVGVWQPKVVPVIKGQQQSWLPPESMGLRVGDVVVPVPSDRASKLVDALVEARAAGATEITFDGHRIPVTDESIAAAQTLVKEAVRTTSGAAEDKPEAPAEAGRIGVIIDDNIGEASFVRKRRETTSEPGGAPQALRTNLYEFQLAGYRWLQDLWCAGATGGVLADDMGLGKTVQTLAFLAWVRHCAAKGDRRPFLIVGPTGLLRNWRAEHDRHLADPDLGQVLEAHGEGLRALRASGGGRAQELATGLPSLDLDALQRPGWVLTTYENLRDYQHSFTKVPWLVVVLDEAQRIKNPGVMTTDAAKALQAEFTLAVTGTPVENHLGDLWSIADAVQPGVLGSMKQFAENYASDGTDPAKLEELRRRVQVENPPPLMLRRLKQDHLPGLPLLTPHVERVPMPDVQAEQYDRVVAAAKDGGSHSQAAMLEALQRMRAVSLHPYETQIGGDDEFIAASARLTHAVHILDGVRDRGEKALVFVEALAMQAALTALLQRRYRLQQPPIVINGSVAGHTRKDRVDRFQARPGFDVMLLSPRAGGVGLTITAANHVIHLSRWWNPAVEDQATDRVYRIGQEREVHVHLPLAIHPRHGDGSFDALLNTLLDRKRTLSRGVLAPAGVAQSDLRDLYTATVKSDGPRHSV